MNLELYFLCQNIIPVLLCAVSGWAFKMYSIVLLFCIWNLTRSDFCWQVVVSKGHAAVPSILASCPLLTNFSADVDVFDVESLGAGSNPGAAAAAAETFWVPAASPADFLATFPPPFAVTFPATFSGMSPMAFPAPFQMAFPAPFSAGIPAGIPAPFLAYRMPPLQSLTLENSFSTGDILQDPRIPLDVGLLPQTLVHLFLSGWSLEARDLAAFGGFRQLHSLTLYHVSVADGAATASAFLANLTELRQLEVNLETPES